MFPVVGEIVWRRRCSGRPPASTSRKAPILPACSSKPADSNAPMYPKVF